LLLPASSGGRRQGAGRAMPLPQARHRHAGAGGARMADRHRRELSDRRQRSRHGRCRRVQYSRYQVQFADSFPDRCGARGARPAIELGGATSFMNRPASIISQQRVFTSLLLLWLAGVALRLTILAVPPVIPLIHDELNLSATEIGVLTGLPSLLFAFAAVPGSLLIARLGVRNALGVGLALTATAGALRGALPDVSWLYGMTIVMGAGVAIMQVTMPPAVRAWLPDRIGFATAIYTNGLLLGEILPVALMLPMVLPLVGGSWQKGFVFWSVPVVLIACLVVLFAPT